MPTPSFPTQIPLSPSRALLLRATRYLNTTLQPPRPTPTPQPTPWITEPWRLDICLERVHSSAPGLTARIEATIFTTWITAAAPKGSPASSSAPFNLHVAVRVWTYWNGNETNSHSCLKSSADPTDSWNKKINLLVQGMIPCMPLFNFLSSPLPTRSFKLYRQATQNWSWFQPQYARVCAHTHIHTYLYTICLIISTELQVSYLKSLPPERLLGFSPPPAGLEVPLWALMPLESSLWWH